MTELLGAERVFYAVLFGLGLFTGVYAMLHGSVRTGHDPNELKAPPAAFNAPVIAGALVAFGAAGYLVATYVHTTPVVTILTAVLAAGVGWVGMTVLMAQWALKGPLIDLHEELEELQGTIATVTRPIHPEAPGEVAYVFRGQQLRTAARTLSGGVAGVGTDVVIEKIENGVADVELWSVVEQRL